jgi:hypothetical protein
MLNTKNRVFKNPDYLKFIRRLPCAITDISGVQAHHAATKGMGGITNDYFAVPLTALKHTGSGHITENQLADEMNEDIQQRIIFYLSLYIEWKFGSYDLEEDEENYFYQLRKKLNQF